MGGKKKGTEGKKEGDRGIKNESKMKRCQSWALVSYISHPSECRLRSVIQQTCPAARGLAGEAVIGIPYLWNDDFASCDGAGKQMTRLASTVPSTVVAWLAREGTTWRGMAWHGMVEHGTVWSGNWQHERAQSLGVC